jgi:hypothetical protein
VLTKTADLLWDPVTIDVFNTYEIRVFPAPAIANPASIPRNNPTLKTTLEKLTPGQKHTVNITTKVTAANTESLSADAVFRTCKNGIYLLAQEVVARKFDSKPRG